MNEQATIGILDQFQTDLIRACRRVPNKGFFLVLLGCWLGMFQCLGNSTLGYFKTASLFGWLRDTYNTLLPDGSYTDDRLGLWIPFLVLGLLWWKREDLLKIPLRTWWPGLLLVALGVALHVVGYLIQQPRLSVLALFTGVYGLAGLAWGPQLLSRIFFPYFLFVFCIPFSTALDSITFHLRLMSSQLVEWIAHGVFSIDVVRDGTILRNPSGQYQYEVAGACSGIHSLMSIGLMGTIAAFLFFHTWWRRALLILAAAPLAVAGNAVRLLSIIIAAEVGGQSWGNWIHDGGPYGVISLLPYVPAFFGLLWLCKWLKEPLPT